AFAIGKEVQDLLHLAIANDLAQTNAVHIVERHHYLEAAGFDFEEVEPLDLGADRATADLLDYAHPMVGINDFVANTKTVVVIHKGRNCVPVGAIRSYGENH